MHVENIKVEDHIVIVGMAGNSPYDNEELYGGPAKVVGICAPYIAIRPVVDPETGDVANADRLSSRRRFNRE
jgi:hypothetical protein